MRIIINQSIDKGGAIMFSNRTIELSHSEAFELSAFLRQLESDAIEHYKYNNK